MTPSQIRRIEPTNVLTDLRTQIAAIVLALQVIGYKITSPGERVDALTTEVHSEVQKLDEKITAVRVRTDTLADVSRKVDILIRARCLDTKDEFRRGVLGCDELPPLARRQ